MTSAINFTILIFESILVSKIPLHYKLIIATSLCSKKNSHFRKPFVSRHPNTCHPNYSWWISWSIEEMWYVTTHLLCITTRIDETFFLRQTTHLNRYVLINPIPFVGYMLIVIRWRDYDFKWDWTKSIHTYRCFMLISIS